MENLLVNDFKSHYSVVRITKIKTSTFLTDFTLKDEKACTACTAKGHDSMCTDQEVIRFTCQNKRTTVIDYEGFINSLAGTKAGSGKKCDNILYTSDKDKFILNELTCSQLCYITPYTAGKKAKPGKRAMAVKQFNDTIEKLCAVPAIETYILSFNQRIGLFACRLKAMVKDITGDNNEGVKGMQKFLQPLTATLSIETPEELNNGFTFVQILYPYPYNL